MAITHLLNHHIKQISSILNGCLHQEMVLSPGVLDDCVVDLYHSMVLFYQCPKDSYIQMCWDQYASQLVSSLQMHSHHVRLTHEIMLINNSLLYSPTGTYDDFLDLLRVTFAFQEDQYWTEINQNAG